MVVVGAHAGMVERRENLAAAGNVREVERKRVFAAMRGYRGRALEKRRVHRDIKESLRRSVWRQNGSPPRGRLPLYSRGALRGDRRPAGPGGLYQAGRVAWNDKIPTRGRRKMGS